MNYSLANGSFVADATSDVRADFIRKVYSLFSMSLLVTVGVGAMAAPYAKQMLGMLPALAILGFVCGIGMAFGSRVRGLNLGLLTLYAAVQGAIVGPLLIMLETRYPGVPLQASCLTLAVFGGLTLYVFVSKKDFSFLGGMLFVGIIALLVASIVMFFVHVPLISTIYSLFGILLFSGFILYDTSQIMLRLRTDEAAVGAISLYLDFINLFWMILRLFTSRR